MRIVYEVIRVAKASAGRLGKWLCDFSRSSTSEDVSVRRALVEEKCLCPPGAQSFDNFGQALEVANLARNEAYSYYNTNSRSIEQLEIEVIEAAQITAGKILQLKLSTSPSRVRVVFLVPDTTLWDVYSPIYDIMVKSKLFEPIVISFNRCDVLADKSASVVQDFFDSIGVPVILEGYSGEKCAPIHSFQPDYVFYTLGTVAYPEEYRIEFVSKSYRTCYLSYGFLMVNELDYQFGQSFHQSAWAVFASTEREKREYDKRCRRRHPNAVISGYPKFDIYSSVPARSAGRAIVIWAPHWTILDVYPGLNFGTFAENREAIVGLMRRHREIDFYFKPHPNLKFACVKSGLFTEDEYEDFLVRLESMDNVKVWKHGGYFELFKNSSALITDSISFIAEYLPSGKPLLFLERSDRARMTEEAEAILGLHYKDSQFSSLDEFIETVVFGVDFMAERRAAALGPLLNYHGPGSAQFIVDYLVDNTWGAQGA